MMLKSVISLLIFITILTGCKIEGTIFLNGVGLEGVTVTLNGSASEVTTTNSKGKFVFNNLNSGQYTVTPSIDGHSFIPGSLEITKTSSTKDVERVNFDVSAKYFIISESSKLALNKVTEFISLKKQQGYEVITKSISDILIEYDGIDVPEKIRNYLIASYSESPVGYLMLIGSLETIPSRIACPDATVSKFIPTDTYYMDLKGNWDMDSDGYYGEYGDDDVRTDLNLVSGRIPFDDNDTIEQILDRIITYENSSDPYKKDVLLAGARLTLPFDTPLFINSAILNYILPSGLNETTLYQDPIGPYCDGSLTTNSLIDEWASNDYGTVCFFSHGSENMLHLYPSSNSYFHKDVTFRPSKPAVIFTSACNINNPSDANSLGMFLLKNGFAVCIFGSSEVTHISKDLTTFEAQLKLAEYYFVDGNTLGYTELRAFKFLSSELEIPKDISGPDHYQNLFAFNLMGDPSIRLR